MDGSRKASQYLKGRELALIPPRVYENHEEVPPDLGFKGLTSPSSGEEMKQTLFEAQIGNDLMPKEIGMVLEDIKRGEILASSHFPNSEFPGSSRTNVNGEEMSDQVMKMENI